MIVQSVVEQVDKPAHSMKSNKIHLIICLIMSGIGCTVGCYSLYIHSNNPKIGFVQSGELIYGYEGMKEAQRQFQAKQRSWQMNLDTLQMDFQRAVNQYNNEFSQLPAPEKKQRELQLRKQEEQLIQYERTLKDQAGDEDRKMSQIVIDQITGYIKEYRELHDYDVILGTTTGESVIAGSDRINITQELLQYINQKYESSASTVTPGSSK